MTSSTCCCAGLAAKTLSEKSGKSSKSDKEASTEQVAAAASSHGQLEGATMSSRVWSALYSAIGLAPGADEAPSQQGTTKVAKAVHAAQGGKAAEAHGASKHKGESRQGATASSESGSGHAKEGNWLHLRLVSESEPAAVANDAASKEDLPGRGKQQPGAVKEAAAVEVEVLQDGTMPENRLRIVMNQGEESDNASTGTGIGARTSDGDVSLFNSITPTHANAHTQQPRSNGVEAPSKVAPRANGAKSHSTHGANGAPWSSSARSSSPERHAAKGAEEGGGRCSVMDASSSIYDVYMREAQEELLGAKGSHSHARSARLHEQRAPSPPRASSPPRAPSPVGR